MKVYLPILLLVICGFNQCFAQDKFEKEYRIKKETVPKDAVGFIRTLNFANKVKWYKEESMTSYSYEAKTYHQGIKYSIEFDSLGRIEDIEYKISFAEIPTETRHKMEAYFNLTFQKWKINKTQVHLIGTASALIEYMKEGVVTPAIVAKYELVLNGRVTNKSKLMEYLFAENGDLERSSNIIQKNTDHLAY